MPITIESRGHWTQPRAVHVGVRLRSGGQNFDTRGSLMIFASRLAAVTLAALMCWAMPASAPQAQPQPLPPPPQQGPATFGPDELVGAGHKFFGNVSRGLASIIERAVSQWGLPNGYVLGEEGSGAFVAGLRYGEGTLYTKNAGDLRVYWQGPSVGFD